jgi:hypothetical protein
MTTTVTKEADLLEAAIGRARYLTEAQQDAIWDAWQDHGYGRACGVLAALTMTKQARDPLLVRKQGAADVIDAAIERLRTAATTAAQQHGDQAIADLIDRMAQSIAPTAGMGAPALADDQKTKQRRPSVKTLFEEAADELAKGTMP